MELLILVQFQTRDSSSDSVSSKDPITRRIECFTVKFKSLSMRKYSVCSLSGIINRFISTYAFVDFLYYETHFRHLQNNIWYIKCILFFKMCLNINTFLAFKLITLSIHVVINYSCLRWSYDWETSWRINSFRFVSYFYTYRINFISEVYILHPTSYIFSGLYPALGFI